MRTWWSFPREVAPYVSGLAGVTALNGTVTKDELLLIHCYSFKYMLKLSMVVTNTECLLFYKAVMGF